MRDTPDLFDGLSATTLFALWLAIAVAVTAFIPDSAFGQQAWHTVTGPDKSFTAEIPAAPDYTSVEMKTSTAPYTMHQYLLEQGEIAYIVQTAVYPDDVVVANPKDNLQSGLDNVAKGMDGGKWASVDWVTYQGLTAVDAVGAKGDYAIRTFSVMKGRQIVTLTYAGPAGSVQSADINRFIASLRLAQ